MFFKNLLNHDSMGREVDTFGVFGFRISILVSQLFASAFSVLFDVIVICIQLMKLNFSVVLYRVDQCSR